MMVGRIAKYITAQFAFDIGGADRRCLLIKEIMPAFCAGGRDIFVMHRSADKHPGIHGDIAVRMQKTVY